MKWALLVVCVAAVFWSRRWWVRLRRREFTDEWFAEHEAQHRRDALSFEGVTSRRPFYHPVRDTARWTEKKRP